MPKKKKGDYTPHITPENAPVCDIASCGQRGFYKAPKSKEELSAYQWYCLDHIREYNQKWDFFSDMNRDEIEDFMRDAVTGHRPTWNRETMTRKQYTRLQDALYEFLEGGKRAPKPTPSLPTKLRKALAMLDLEYPYTTRELKACYRAMVKKHHPDVNKGDKRSEEQFKRITAAYAVLSEHIKNPPATP